MCDQTIKEFKNSEQITWFHILEEMEPKRGTQITSESKIYICKSLH